MPMPIVSEQNKTDCKISSGFTPIFSKYQTTSCKDLDSNPIIKMYNEAWEKNNTSIPIELERNAFIIRDKYYFKDSSSIQEHLKYQVEKLSRYDKEPEVDIKKLYLMIDSLDLEGYYNLMSTEDLAIIGW